MTFENLFLVLLLLFAAFTDIRYRRIPNSLILIGAVVALSLSVFHIGLVSPLQAVLGALVGLIFFGIPYAMGKLGAGDVKLLAVVGLFLGPALTAAAAIYSMLSGGVLAVGCVICRTKDVPYGVAIAIGTIILLLTQLRTFS